MKVDRDKITKDFYTTLELIKEPWFPIRSTITIRKLIESGKLKAVDISTNKHFKRYRIEKDSAIDFVENQTLNTKIRKK